MFAQFKKTAKAEDTRPLILVILKKALPGEINRETLIKNMGLPFKLDIVKNNVWPVDINEFIKKTDIEHMKKVSALIIHTNDNPTDVSKGFDGLLGKDIPAFYTKNALSVLPADQQGKVKGMSEAFKKALAK